MTAQDMRNLMLIALGSTGLWLALLAFLTVCGVLQALRCPALARATFKS